MQHRPNHRQLTAVKVKEPKLIIALDGGLLLGSGGNEVELRDRAEDEQDLCSILIKLQDHHWRIRQADLEILLRPDGSDWLLGSGAHARVRQRHLLPPDMPRSRNGLSA